MPWLYFCCIDIGVLTMSTSNTVKHLLFEGLTYLSAHQPGKWYSCFVGALLPKLPLTNRYSKIYTCIHYFLIQLHRLSNLIFAHLYPRLNHLLFVLTLHRWRQTLDQAPFCLMLVGYLKNLNQPVQYYPNKKKMPMFLFEPLIYG